MENREQILDKVKEVICKDRNFLYGEPEQSFDEIAKLWSAYLDKELKPKDAAIMLALFKVARMKTSKVLNEDNFVDALGYFACAFEVAKQQEREKTNYPECFGSFSCERLKCLQTCRYSVECINKGGKR